MGPVLEMDQITKESLFLMHFVATGTYNIYLLIQAGHNLVDLYFIANLLDLLIDLGLLWYGN